MKVLRSSPFLPVASTLHFFIFSCCVIGVAGAAMAVPPDRQVFMKALRSAPVLPVASALHDFILLCCVVIGALAIASAAKAEAAEAVESANAAINAILCMGWSSSVPAHHAQQGLN